MLLFDPFVGRGASVGEEGTRGLGVVYMHAYTDGGTGPLYICAALSETALKLIGDVLNRERSGDKELSSLSSSSSSSRVVEN